jgi:hypothetical protein
MGVEHVWAFKSSVWLGGMGLEEGEGRGIKESNSLISLP